MFKIPKANCKIARRQTYSCNAQLFYKEKEGKRKDNYLHQFPLKVSKMTFNIYTSVEMTWTRMSRFENATSLYNL